MKFFRPIRKNSKSNVNYIKYAIGEITLVVVGILIALQVNNLNEKRIEKKSMNDYFQKIVSNVQGDIKESEGLLKFRQDHIISCNKVSKALIENVECKIRRCNTIAKSTEKRCKQCVFRPS
ncbi:MAG: hypothetical protein HOI78_00005 [Polaribacter sp.]|nr:hypothetical protein [Polaribacter sp.]